MADQHPQDQPKPVPGEAGRDWNEVSAEEIEQTLSNAADLAYELAGDMGVAGDQPKFRETSELQAIESALDIELKQIDHLVSKTKEQLGGLVSPAQPDAGGPIDTSTPSNPTLSVPDFMAEFMTDEPVTVFPEKSGSGADSGSEEPEPAVPAAQAESIPGLVGVGTLRQSRKKPPKSEKRTLPSSPDLPAHEPLWARTLGKPVFWVCQGAATMLEILDRPLTSLSPKSRRALHVTALAAFCVCLTMFVLSLLFS